MKKITATLVLLGTLTLGLAVDATIDAQIAEIQSAPAQERVQLMNEFKQQLATMNQEQRQEAIAAMQAEMQAAGEMTQTRVHERSRVREAQMEAAGEMVRTQSMNQKQMGNQEVQKFINGAGTTPHNPGAGAGSGQTVTIPTH